MKPAAAVHNFIRGLSPHPAAWTMHDGTMLKIYRSEKSEFRIRMQKQAKSLFLDGILYVAAGSGTISVLEIQQEGKKRMSAEEFLRGYKFNDGDLLK